VSTTRDHDIIAGLDIRAEYAALGVNINGDTPSADGWVTVHAIGRDDRNPSAAVNLTTGRYKDHGGDGDSLSLWDFAAKYGNFQDWRDARDHYAAKVGVAAGNANGNGRPQAKCKQRKKPASEAELTKALKDNTPAVHNALLKMYCDAKHSITAEGIRQCGGRPQRWGDHRVLSFLGRDPIDNPQATAVVLLRVTGKPFPPLGTLNQRKSHTIGGSVNSWLSSGDVANATTILDVEGITDWLAAVSVGLPDGCVCVTNTGGAGARGKLSCDWAKGKRVIVPGDADQPGVDGQRKAAASYQKAGAAEVLFAQLPYEIEPTHGRDLRDLLLEGHKVDELPLVPAPVEEIPPTDDEENEPGIIKQLADAICAGNHFARDASGRLRRYVGGVYRDQADRYVKAQVKQLLEEWAETGKWSSRRASEVVEYIAVDAPELPERPRIDLINCHNCMVRVEDGVSLPHDPKYLSTVQLPVKWDPAATCPAIDKFCAEVFPGDAIDLAYEFPALLMTPDTTIQKAALLYGEGGNGKSVYCRLLVAFIGKENTAALSLHRLEANPFSASRLLGKLANICPDLPSEHLAGTSIFKAITGGDVITGERKFCESFEFTPFARLVFSANHLPRSSDGSPGFFERWLVVPFDAKFRGTDQEIPREVLDARLSAPGELSGLLNRAVKALAGIRARGRLSEPESVRRAWDEFHATTDPLAVWLDRNTVDDAQATTTKQLLRVAYNAAAERAGRPAMSAKAFTQAINKLRPDVQEAQRTVSGRVQWCYLGIGLLHDGDSLTTSQDSQDSPNLTSNNHARNGNSNGEGKDRDRDLGVEQERVNPVNPVNPVNDCHHDDVEETPAGNGLITVRCRQCGRKVTCPAEESANA
jgi:putative DNA primase/helicase